MSDIALEAPILVLPTSAESPALRFALDGPMLVDAIVDPSGYREVLTAIRR